MRAPHEIYVPVFLTTQAVFFYLLRRWSGEKKVKNVFIKKVKMVEAQKNCTNLLFLIIYHAHEWKLAKCLLVK